MNLFWLYLIIEQIKRILNRPAGQMDDDITATSYTQSLNGGQDTQPLIGSMKSAEEYHDTDEERDDLHISSVAVWVELTSRGQDPKYLIAQNPLFELPRIK